MEVEDATGGAVAGSDAPATFIGENCGGSFSPHPETVHASIKTAVDTVFMWLS